MPSSRLPRSDGFKLARRSGDEDAIRAYVAVIAQTGPHTNPTWITSQAVLSAYDRGLIDETELDCLSV